MRDTLYLDYENMIDAIADAYIVCEASAVGIYNRGEYVSMMKIESTNGGIYKVTLLD